MHPPSNLIFLLWEEERSRYFVWWPQGAGGLGAGFTNTIPSNTIPTYIIVRKPSQYTIAQLRDIVL